MSTKEKPRPRSCSLPIPKKEVVVQQIVDSKRKTEQTPNSLFDNENILIDSSFGTSSKSPSMNELRRSSFSGLPGIGGLAGFSALIGSPNASHIGRHGSERIKSPKRQKKGSMTDISKSDEKRKSDQSLHKVARTSHYDHVSNKLFKQKDKSSFIFVSKELVPPPPRPKSALGHYDDGKTKLTDIKRLDKSDMQRGKSMPSLHLLLDRFGSGSSDKSSSKLLIPDRLKSPKKTASHTYSVPYPIITITEHSPVASIQFFLNQENCDSPRDESEYNLFSPPCRQMEITRSQTDSDISYFSETTTEASASTHYVTKNGQLSLTVILKAVHSIALKDAICSLKVCKIIHEMLNRLLSLGVLPRFVPPIEIDSTGMRTSFHNILYLLNLLK